jgi:hypothetical protein
MVGKEGKGKMGIGNGGAQVERMNVRCTMQNQMKGERARGSGMVVKNA